MNQSALEELRRRIVPHKEYRKAFIDEFDKGNIKTFLENVRAFCTDSDFIKKTGIDKTMLETLVHLNEHPSHLIENSSRRDFLKGASSLAAGAALYSAMPKTVYGQQHLLVESIEKEMQVSTKEILQTISGLHVIDYDPKGEWRLNYVNSVFNRQKLDKPLLALFYDSNEDLSKRGAIIFKKIAENFPTSLDFIAVNLPSRYQTEYDRTGREASASVGGGNELGVFATKEGKKNRQIPPIRGPPSFALYSLWDPLEGESPEKNDGRIKLLDVSYGAPTKTSDIPTNVRNYVHYWIKPNVFLEQNPDNDGKIYRRLNTFNFSPVGHLKK